VTDEETLVELTLPAEALLSGGRTSTLLALHTIPAGATTTWKPTSVGGCCPWLNISVVLEGAASIRAEAPIHVIRAAGGPTAEEVTAGSTVAVSVGDTVVWHAAVAWEWTVTDDAPMLVVSIPVGDLRRGSPVPGWREEDIAFGPTRSFPPGPYTLRFRRATLAPEAVLPAGSSIVQLAVDLPGQDARTSVLTDNSVRNIGSNAITLVAVTLDLTARDATPTIPDITASPVAMASPVAAGRSR